MNNNTPPNNKGNGNNNGNKNGGKAPKNTQNMLMFVVFDSCDPGVGTVQQSVHTGNISGDYI